MSTVKEIATQVAAGKSKLIPGLVQEALNKGANANEILQAMINAMGVVGEKFSAGEIFVPEMLISAKAMQKGLDALKPALANAESTSLGKCIIGTVAGDLHDIGKNLVALMIGSAGFDIIDLGVDVSPEKFMASVKENPDAKIVACSALLTTTMSSLKETVKTIKSSDFTNIKVMIGGAPITQEYANEIGADGYAQDAGSAVSKAKELLID